MDKKWAPSGSRNGIAHARQSSARPVLGPLPGRDEQGDHRPIRIRRMPGAARIDRIFARTELMRLLRPIRQFLMERHSALDAADDFLARRMNLPARPRFVETIERDDPAFVEIVGMALAIGFIPFKAGEFGLGHGAGAM